jgi:hypothetical protein
MAFLTIRAPVAARATLVRHASFSRFPPTSHVCGRRLSSVVCPPSILHLCGPSFHSPSLSALDMPSAVPCPQGRAVFSRVPEWRPPLCPIVLGLPPRRPMTLAFDSETVNALRATAHACTVGMFVVRCGRGRGSYGRKMSEPHLRGHRPPGDLKKIFWLPSERCERRSPGGW